MILLNLATHSKPRPLLNPVISRGFGSHFPPQKQKVSLTSANHSPGSGIRKAYYPMAFSALWYLNSKSELEEGASVTAMPI
jgi:hypothetical protein